MFTVLRVKSRPSAAKATLLNDAIEASAFRRSAPFPWKLVVTNPPESLDVAMVDRLNPLFWFVADTVAPAVPNSATSVFPVLPISPGKSAGPELGLQFAAVSQSEVPPPPVQVYVIWAA